MNQIDDTALATVIGGTASAARTTPASDQQSRLEGTMNQLRDAIDDVARTRPNPQRSFPFVGF